MGHLWCDIGTFVMWCWDICDVILGYLWCDIGTFVMWYCVKKEAALIDLLSEKSPTHIHVFSTSEKVTKIDYTCAWNNLWDIVKLLQKEALRATWAFFFSMSDLVGDFWSLLEHRLQQRSIFFGTEIYLKRSITRDLGSFLFYEWSCRRFLVIFGTEKQRSI